MRCSGPYFCVHMKNEASGNIVQQLTNPPISTSLVVRTTLTNPLSSPACCKHWLNLASDPEIMSYILFPPACMSERKVLYPLWLSHKRGLGFGVWGLGFGVW